VNRIHRLLTVAVPVARQGLPWLVVMAISATVAYAMTVAVVGGPSGSESPRRLTVAEASAEAFIAEAPPWSATTPAAFSSDERACDDSGGRLLYVGLNTWIPAEPKQAPCPEDAP
jgi:hypothetical protein